MDKTFFEQTFSLDPRADLPIYEQLLSYFRNLIGTGQLKPGDKLIPETMICDLLNISRTTVRQAFDQLVEEGLVVRQRGRGSFVAENKLRRPINYLYNFTENMTELGVTPKSVVLSSSVEFVNASVRSHLSLPLSQDKVFHLLRLRCGNDEPLLLEDTYVPYYLCKGIEKNDFSVSSLYRVLEEQYGLKLYHATETMEAVLISKSEAQLLGCSSRSAGFRITRTSHLDSGYTFEYTSSITRADRCSFQMDLYKNSGKGQNRPISFQRTVVL